MSDHDAAPDRFLSVEDGARAKREARRRWQVTPASQKRLVGGAAALAYVELILDGLTVRERS